MLLVQIWRCICDPSSESKSDLCDTLQMSKFILERSLDNLGREGKGQHPSVY